MEGSGDMDHSVVAPSLDELIEGAVRVTSGMMRKVVLLASSGCENRNGLSCLGFRADGGFDRIAFSNEFLDGRDADKTIS
jgi:hypothetical protein